MISVTRKPVFEVSDQANTNRAVQKQKMVGGLNFGFRKKRNCTIYGAKTKALISFAATAQLICAFDFAYAKIRFSHGVAHSLYI